MNKDYIYESNKNSAFIGNEAIIILPDIYCQTDYSKHTAEQFAETFKKPVFLVDYFFLSTNKTNNFNENDREQVHGLMKNFTGDEFVIFFKKVMGEIKVEYSQLEQFTVIGFCFGGRLAYLAGAEKDVSKVVSFYGAGALTMNYINGKTPIEYLLSSKKESDLPIHSFFGIHDPSIPETDRQTIKEEFKNGRIAYEAHEYEAGHAYFQEGRPNYNVLASRASWEVLKNIS